SDGNEQERYEAELAHRSPPWRARVSFSRGLIPFEHAVDPGDTGGPAHVSTLGRVRPSGGATTGFVLGSIARRTSCTGDRSDGRGAMTEHDSSPRSLFLRC